MAVPELGTAAVEALEATELVVKAQLEGLGLGEQTWLDLGGCVRASPVGVPCFCRSPSKPVSANERFKEAGEDIGGVRTLKGLDGDTASC